MNELEAFTKIIGSHEVQFAPPDVIHVIIRGVLDEADVRELIHLTTSQSDLLGSKMCCICDMSQFERMTSAVRKVSVSVDRPYPYYAVAFLGASFATRTILEMVMRAGRIVSRKHFHFTHKFVISNDEALAFFDEQRRKQEQS